MVGAPEAHPSSPGLCEGTGIQFAFPCALCSHDKRKYVGSSDHFSKVSAFVGLFGRFLAACAGMAGIEQTAVCDKAQGTPGVVSNGHLRRVIALLLLAIPGVKLNTELQNLCEGKRVQVSTAS